jgi:hypothetical protein
MQSEECVGTARSEATVAARIFISRYKLTSSWGLKSGNKQLGFENQGGVMVEAML